MRKVRSISRSYYLIWMDIHASLATKLLVGYGRDDLSTMLALGLRNLVLSIETTERRRKEKEERKKKGDFFPFFSLFFSSQSFFFFFFFFNDPFDDENKLILLSL